MSQNLHNRLYRHAQDMDFSITNAQVTNYITKTGTKTKENKKAAPQQIQKEKQVTWTLVGNMKTNVILSYWCKHGSTLLFVPNPVVLCKLIKYTCIFSSAAGIIQHCTSTPACSSTNTYMQSHNRSLFLVGFNLCVRCYFIPNRYTDLLKRLKIRSLYWRGRPKIASVTIDCSLWTWHEVSSWFFRPAFLTTCFTFPCELSTLKLHQVSLSVPSESKNLVKHFRSVLLSEMDSYLILPHSELLI